MPDADGNPTPEELESEGDNDVIRGLREQVKTAGREAKAEADAAKRELAFVKAGVNPDDPQQGYFVRGYQGEISAEAIKEAATAAGFLGTTTTSEPQGITPQERAAFAATEGAASATAPQPVEDRFADLRGINPFRSGVTPAQFGMQIAERVKAAGGDVAYDGPQSPVIQR